MDAEPASTVQKRGPGRPRKSEPDKKPKYTPTGRKPGRPPKSNRVAKVSSDDTRGSSGNSTKTDLDIPKFKGGSSPTPHGHHEETEEDEMPKATGAALVTPPRPERAAPIPEIPPRRVDLSKALEELDAAMTAASCVTRGLLNREESSARRDALSKNKETLMLLGCVRERLIRALHN